MSWDLTDDELRKGVTATVAPPSTVDDLLGDDMWANVFSVWATDLGFQRGDYTASHLFELWTDQRHHAGYDAIRDKYVASGNAYGLDWPSSVVDRFERVDAGMDDQSAALAELGGATVEKLDPYVTAFQADIREIQSSEGSDPQAVGLTRDRIDQAVVDKVNQAALKSLPEAGGVDSFVQFWINRDLLLIGDEHPAAYLDFAKNGGQHGQMYMNAKGGAFSRGTLIVQGISSTNQDAVKAAVRRFSQKKLDFR